MRYSRTILFVLPPALLAAKLQDFQPRITSLGPQCNAAYNQEVSSCSKTDFDPNGFGCSADCLEGLQTLIPTVRAACASEDFGDGPNLVKLFIQGTGPQTLCKNYNSLIASISEPATQPATSSAAPSSNSDIESEGTSAQVTSTSSSEASATASTDSETTSASSSHSTQASTTSDLLTNSSSTASSTTSSTTSTSSRKSDSGGGSPFDTPAGSEACGMGVSMPTATGIFILLVFAAMAR